MNQASRTVIFFYAAIFLCFTAGNSEGQPSDNVEVTGDLELRYNDCFNPAHKGPHTSFVVRDLKTRKETELDVSTIDVTKLKPGKRVRLKGSFKEVAVAKGVKGKGKKVFKPTKVTYESAASDEIIPTSEGSVPTAEPPAQAAPAVTDLNVLVIHANTLDTTASSSNITAMDDLLFGGTQNLSKAIEDATYGHYRLVHGATITVDVAINAAGTNYTGMATAMESAAIAAGYNPATYDRYLVCCPNGTESGGSTNWSAYGYYGSSGKTVWSYRWTGTYFDGILHELGHNFGFRHSGTGTNQYGDRTCVMGYSHSSTASSRCTSTYSAAKKVQAGWLSPFPGAYASLTEDATYDIYPISQAPGTAPKMRAVQLDGTDYHVSYRRYLPPYAWLNNTGDQDKVFVHTAAGGALSWRVGDMTSGNTYAAGTTTITFEGHGPNNEYATVSFDLADDNDKPIANAQYLSTELNVAAAITLDGTDSDTIPSDTLTYAVVSGPSNGTFSINESNLTYTPNNNYIGSDSFVWSINDGHISSFATVSIAITDSNVSPVANNQSVTSYLNASKAITLTAGDADGDSLTYSIVANPSNGSLSGTVPNVTYTPNTNFSGDDSFTFKANDGLIGSNTATVSITISSSPNLHAAYETELAAVAALGDLTTAPAMYTDDTLPGTLATVAAGDLKIIYYDVLDYAGNPTRACAWIGVPSGATAGSPVPGMVLVHGGGGTASQAWVEQWTERGYAAISMSVEGLTEAKVKHAMAGPHRDDYDPDVSPFSDQWMYHAVADSVLANSLLRSLPEVDASKVGLTGFSWGGVITSTVIGIDNRFLFAIPTYGCGHLYDSRNYYGHNLASNESYKQIWDPMVRIANATMPVLWLSWPQEMHFPMDSLAYTYHGAPGTRMVSLRPGMGHSGNYYSPEYYDYADDMVSGAGPWCVQQSISLVGDTATVVFNSTKTLNSASLVTTTGNDTITSNITTNLIWTEIPADSLVESPVGTWTVTATLPAGVTGWFVNTKATGSDTGDLYGYVDSEIIASSDYQEVIDLSLSPAASLAIEHPLADDQSTRTVSVAYTGPANVEISSITISNQSHAGAFSSLTSAPLVILNPTPVTETVTVQFDNTVAGLTDGQTATGTLTIVWDELDGSTDQVTLPVSATAQAAVTVVHDTSADWASQDVNSVDNVIIQNDATVTVGEFVEQNIVVGGSFEAPDVADGSASGLAAGNSTLTGWTITAAGVTVIDSWNNGGGIDPAPVGSDGEQFLQLQRHPDGAGTISQTLATEDGATYQLSFDYSGIYPGTLETTITYAVGGDAYSVDLTLVNGQLPWASETFEFTATAATTALSFTGDNVGGYWGASIDNVSVTVLPATSDTADTIIVNNGASPTTATLNIDQDYSLTATTSIALGVGTGAGFVNQSTGTVTTADLAINDSGTGDLSQYNLSGGELSVSNVISINANGELNQTGGTISGSGTIANDGSFSYNSTTNQTLSGVISGAGSVTKDNTGTLTLSASNTYTGGTTVSDGTLDLVGQNRIDGALTVDGAGSLVKLSGTGNNAFSGISSVTLQNGGTFTDNSQGSRVQSVSAPITFNNGGTMTSEAGANGSGTWGNFLFINGINVTGSGLATISANRIGFNFAQTITVADTVAGAGTDLLILSDIRNDDRHGTITKAGDGTLTLTGITTDTDPWAITGGTLEIGGAGQLQSGTYAGTIANSGTFEYNSTANQTMSGAISGSGTLVKDNTGTLTLTGANSYTGATTVSAGILSLGNGTTNTALDDAADLSVASGAVVNLNYIGSDTIDELSLGGALQTPGIWGASGSGATFIDDSFTGTGTLTVTTGVAPSAYQAWVVANGLSDTDALTTADPDGDEVNNLTEFALDRDPAQAGDTGVLPAFEDNVGVMEFTYLRRVNAASYGLTYTVKTKTNLTDLEWGTDGLGTPVVTSFDADFDQVMTSVSTAGVAKRFIRLEVDSQ